MFIVRCWESRVLGHNAPAEDRDLFPVLTELGAEFRLFYGDENESVWLVAGVSPATLENLPGVFSVQAEDEVGQAWPGLLVVLVILVVVLYFVLVPLWNQISDMLNRLLGG